MDRPGTCIIILDKKYNIANSSCHLGSYGSIWTGPQPNKYYMDWSLGPYNIFLVTDRSIYCHMTLSAMNYLLHISRVFVKSAGKYFDSFHFLANTRCDNCQVLKYYIRCSIFDSIFVLFCFCFLLFFCIFSKFHFLHLWY